MTTPIIISPANRTPGRVRRGSGLGVAAFMLSVITGFWAIVLWAVRLGTAADNSGRAIAIVFFTACAIVGFLFFAVTAITATFAFLRNARPGLIWAAVASAIALGALVAGVVTAATIG